MIGRNHVSHEQLSGEKIDMHIPRYNGERDQKLFAEWLGNNMNKASQKEKWRYILVLRDIPLII